MSICLKSACAETELKLSMITDSDYSFTFQHIQETQSPFAIWFARYDRCSSRNTNAKQDSISKDVESMCWRKNTCETTKTSSINCTQESCVFQYSVGVQLQLQIQTKQLLLMHLLSLSLLLNTGRCVFPLVSLSRFCQPGKWQVSTYMKETSTLSQNT